MKYFKELSQEDKERALYKLITKPKNPIFNCLLRVNAIGPDTDYKPASVVKFHFGYAAMGFNVELLADIIYDHDMNTTIKNMSVKDFKICAIPVPISEKLGMAEFDSAKKALTTLLEAGEHYMFDDKCTAYPV